MKISLSPKFINLILLISALSFTKSLNAQDCVAFIKTFTDWVKAKPCQDEGCHTVGVKVSGVTIKDKNADHYPWGYGYYGEGRLGLSGSNLSGHMQFLFSDRKGADGKRFPATKADYINITIFADGRVKFELESWGNTVYYLENVRCSTDGYITGLLRGGSGPSMVTIAIRKETMHPATDGFRTWPN